MTATVILDWLTAAAVVAGLAGAARVSARRIGPAAKALLFMTLSLYLFVAASNVLEHSGVTAAVDSYEDYAEILFFPFALFFVYAAWMRLESNRRLGAERRLRERERTLSTLLGNLPGMAYRCLNDRDWTMEFASQGCAGLTGYEPTDLVNNKVRSYAELIVPEDSERIWEEVQAAVAARQPFRLEYRISDAGGRERWVWEQGTGVYSDNGELEALEGFIIDITKRKTAEEALRRSQQSLLEAQRIAHLGNWEWDIGTNELSWSDETYRIFGLEPGRLAATREAFLEAVHPGDRETVTAAVNDALSGDKPYDIEHRVVRPNGSERYVHEMAEVLRDDAGRPARMIGTVHDITRRKITERELELYRRHLESLVKRRTRELRAAQARLERSLDTLRADEEAGKLIQFKLLPDETSVIGDYRFSRRLIPSMYLSGDFMDCFALDERRVGFYMADVSGHGASSAFVTVLLKSLVRNHLDNYRSGRDAVVIDPAALLTRLNTDVLAENLDKHITIFYGVLDRRENRLTFASAGQFPFPILWQKGAPELLEARTAPVGLFATADYESRALDLTDDFVLFVFSDGILEALPPQSLAEKVALIAAQGAEDDFDLERLTSDLGLDRAGTLPDDIAFLTVRRQNGARG